MTNSEWMEFPPQCFEPELFAELVKSLVLEHAPHGGWLEDEDGLHCADDMVLVIPSPDYLRAHSTQDSC